MKLIYPYIQMILNEDYFKDIEITDDDIESSEYSADATFKYDKPSDWFANEINGKYSEILFIPMNTDGNCTLQDNYNNWKWIVPYIQKRLHYIFTEYGVEYYTPEQVILQNTTGIYKNGYEGCMFNDFHEYKIISKYTIDVVSQGRFFIYIPFFFNFPKTQSYRVVCKLIGIIMKFLWEGKVSGYLEKELILTSLYYQRGYYMYKEKNRIVNISDIINIIHLSLKIQKDIVKDKLSNNRELLCKIWKYFYPDLKYLRPKHPKWVDEIRSLMA